MEGLGLLPIITVFEGSKETHRVRGVAREAPGVLRGAQGLPIEGYEIHMGRSFASPAQSAGLEDTGVAYPFQIQRRSDQTWDRSDGGMDSGGRVLGTYIHGLFHNSGLRRAILYNLAEGKGVSLPQEDDRQGTGGVSSNGGEYDKLAALLRSSLDMGMVYRIAGLEVPGL